MSSRDKSGQRACYPGISAGMECGGAGRPHWLRGLSVLGEEMGGRVNKAWFPWQRLLCARQLTFFPAKELIFATDGLFIIYCIEAKGNW